jgi:hypothetical protein
VALLLVGVWYGSRISSFQIKEVTVVGGATISHDLVRKKVEEQLVGAYFRLVPRRFQPLYPEADIIAQVETIPRLKEVRIDHDTRGVLTVVFTEYEPYALWCDGTTAEARQHCMFIDHTGYAFAPAPQLRGNALVRYFVPGVEPVLEQRVYDDGLFRSAEEFVELMIEMLDLYVTEVRFVNEVDTHYVLTSGAVIQTSNRQSVKETVDNLATIFSNESFAHLADGEFHYIDLRFGDKVYVSEEEYVPEVASSTASSTVVAESLEG